MKFFYDLLGTKDLCVTNQYNFIVTIVYVIVIFSTLVQGLTVEKVYHPVIKNYK